MNVCGNCFNDFEIKSHINAFSSTMGECSFCSNTSTPVLDIEELMDFFLELLGLFESNSSGEPLLKILQEDWNLFSNENVASKILLQVIIDNNPFEKHNLPDVRVRYIPEINEVISYWDHLKDSLKWERRFILERDNLIDFGWDKYFAETISSSEDNIFYRARIHFDENTETYDLKQMGSPPREKSSEGRANPLGIPYLYLSKDIKTTFYETKVLLHDEVSIGKFAINKGERLNLVDFTEIPSAFLGMGDLENYCRRTLLKKRIGKDLSKPIRRYDSKIEYVPTQFICEFLRYVIGADGIIFNSSLNPEGQNVVLFDDQLVECIEVKQYAVSGMDISFEPLSEFRSNFGPNSE